MVTIDFHARNPLAPGTMREAGLRPIVELLQGGAANVAWTLWLDGIAALARSDPTHAFIFRPFHEMTLTGNATWWWAQGSNVSAPEYRAAWRYTHHYLVDIRKVDNLLFAFAPNGAEAYNATGSSATNWYPGDDVVDIACFDYYGKAPDYTAALLQHCGTTVRFAEAHGKVPAICETGYRDGVQNVPAKDAPMWFTEALLKPVLADATCMNVAYMLTWDEGPLFEPLHGVRKQHPTQYWVPTRGDPTFADFVNFAQNPAVILAGEGQCSAHEGSGAAARKVPI